MQYACACALVTSKRYNGKKMDTKLDLEAYDTVDIKSQSDHPTMYEEGSIGVIGPGDEEPGSEAPSKEDKETPSRGGGGGGSWLGFLSVEYYQPYFDVTTSDVFYRILAGMLPYPFKLSSTLSSSPDLYGPFWLCMTLIFTIAISGNLSALFSGDSQWEFHFHEVIVIATVVYSYTWCVPVALWLVLLWRNASDRYSLIKIQSIYGYSMAIFIPVTLIWVINVDALRWMFLVVAILISGVVLAQALWIPLRNETKQIAIGLLAAVFLLHAGVAIGFKFYYFSSSLAPDSPGHVEAPPRPLLQVTHTHNAHPFPTIGTANLKQPIFSPPAQHQPVIDEHNVRRSDTVEKMAADVEVKPPEPNPVNTAGVDEQKSPYSDPSHVT